MITTRVSSSARAFEEEKGEKRKKKGEKKTF